MSGNVIDASALLAFLLDEPGASLVAEALATGGSLLSAVNYSEVISKLGEHGISAEQLASDFAERGLLDLVDIVDFTPDLAEATAGLRTPTKSLGLSLGDRACLAMAKARGLPALTADRRWLQVPGVVVRTIR
ncbi:MAG: type II toxin-antitoxin system VapC family toxin [Bacillota bacterium]